MKRYVVTLIVAFGLVATVTGSLVAQKTSTPVTLKMRTANRSEQRRFRPYPRAECRLPSI
jgi:flagellar motor component MotA